MRCDLVRFGNLLVISGGDFSDNYRQHLKSTAAAEDGADWLFPHHNDEQKWRDEYGSAVCVQSSTNIMIHNIRVRHGLAITSPSQS